MSKALHLQIVARAREIISDPNRWTQDELALSKNGESALPADADAYRFCAVGALQRAAHELCGGHRLATTLAHTIQDAIERCAKTLRNPNLEFSLENLNDEHGGHAAVLQLFDDYLAISS